MEPTRGMYFGLEVNSFAMFWYILNLLILDSKTLTKAQSVRHFWVKKVMQIDSLILIMNIDGS